VKPTRPALAVVGLLTAGLAASTISTASAVEPVSAHLKRPLAGVDSGTFPGSEVPLDNRDNRGPRKVSLPGAIASAAGLGGGVSVSWNQYGTPRTLTRPGGWLATALAGAPVDAARNFLKARSALVGLTPAEVDGLEVVYDSALSGSPAQTPNAQQVTITELQAFGAVTVAAPAVVPVAAGRASLPATGAEVALAVFGVLLIGIAIVVARRMRS